MPYNGNFNTTMSPAICATLRNHLINDTMCFHAVRLLNKKEEGHYIATLHLIFSTLHVITVIVYVVFIKLKCHRIPVNMYCCAFTVTSIAYFHLKSSIEMNHDTWPGIKTCLLSIALLHIRQ